MANNTITFNPDSIASAYGVNLVINTRTDFTSTFKVIRPDKSNFDFTSYTGSSQMAKSASIGSSTGVAGNFTVGFTSASDGEFKLTMPQGETGVLKPGRYVYDVVIVDGSGTKTRAVEGSVIVRGGVTR